jgi:hypothetical protein
MEYGKNCPNNQKDIRPKCAVREKDLISTYEVEGWPFWFPGPDTFISSTYEVEEFGTLQYFIIIKA